METAAAPFRGEGASPSLSLNKNASPPGGEAAERSEAVRWAYGGSRQDDRCEARNTPTSPAGFAVDLSAERRGFEVCESRGDTPFEDYLAGGGWGSGEGLRGVRLGAARPAV
jgi:hypothetical protein